MSVVSLGSANSVEIRDETVYFSDNIVVNYNKITVNNLFYCEFLNLRHSLIDSLDVAYLIMLRYLDLAFSQIAKINLRECQHLE